MIFDCGRAQACTTCTWPVVVRLPFRQNYKNQCKVDEHKYRDQSKPLTERGRRGTTAALARCKLAVESQSMVNTNLRHPWSFKHERCTAVRPGCPSSAPAAIRATPAFLWIAHQKRPGGALTARNIILQSLETAGTSHPLACLEPKPR